MDFSRRSMRINLNRSSGSGNTSSNSSSDEELAYNDTLTIEYTDDPTRITAQYTDSNGNIKDIDEDLGRWRMVETMTDFTADTVSNITTAAQNTLSACELEDGTIVIAYKTASFIKCTIISGVNYTIDYTVTATASSNTDGYFKVAKIPGTNNFVIVWADTASSNQGRFAIYNNIGTQVKEPTTFDDVCTYCSVTTLSNGNIVIVWDDGELKYSVRTSTGDAYEAETLITSTGNVCDVCTLTNDFWAVVSEVSGDDGVLFVYDSSTNPSTLQQSGTTYSGNIDGSNIVNEIHPLDEKGFVIVFHDQNNTHNTIISIWQYVSDTEWINAGIINPFPDSTANAYAGCSSSSSEGLFAIAHPIAVTNDSYDPCIMVYEGMECSELSKQMQTRTFLPSNNNLANGGPFRILLLTNKRMFICWQPS